MGDTSRTVRWPARSILSVALLVALAPRVSAAGVCGDDIDGRRVACRCGDVVVSDVTLRSGDPVVTERCPLDGLVVRAARAAESLTLDLAGHALVGQGVGSGLLVEYGGADGAHVVGGTPEHAGQVVGFHTGVNVPHSSGVRRVEHLVARGNRREGFRIATAGAMLVGLIAERNGGYGFRIRGRGGRLTNAIASENRLSGLRLDSSDTIVEILASANGEHGVIVDGRRNDLALVRSRDNQGHGVIVRGTANVTTGIDAEGNHGGAVSRNAREVAP